jgi:hypothetical protein
LHTLARYSSHKTSTTSSNEGKSLIVELNVLVYVIGREILALSLNQRHSVLLSDKVLCGSGIVASVQLYFTAEEQLEILIRRLSTFYTKAV